MIKLALMAAAFALMLVHAYRVHQATFQTEPKSVKALVPLSLMAGYGILAPYLVTMVYPEAYLLCGGAILGCMAGVAGSFAKRHLFNGATPVLP